MLWHEHNEEGWGGLMVAATVHFIYPLICLCTVTTIIEHTCLTEYFTASLCTVFLLRPHIPACISIKLLVLTIIYGPGNPAKVLVQ